MFEGVKCCTFFNGYDRGLDQFKPQNIKNCDQKIFSIIKGKAHKMFDEQKGKCGESISLGKVQKNSFIEIKRNFRNESSIGWSLKQTNRLYSLFIVFFSLNC
jgi:hypothetical protein